MASLMICLCSRCTSAMAVSYTHLDVYKRQIEHHDKKPMYYATIGAILVEPQSWHLFIGLSAMTKADGTLKRVFEWFTRAEA